MNIKLETITPERAQMLLATNEDDRDFHNRNLSPTQVKAISEDIQNGKWRTNHQPIAMYYDKLKRNYILVDGRHRCTAVVETGITIEILVAYYPTKAEALAAIPTVDRTKPKNAAHILKMSTNLNYHTARVGSVKLVAFLESGARINHTSAVELAIAHSATFDAVHRHEWPAPATVTGALIFAFRKFGPSVAELAHKIAAGEGLDKQEAVLHRLVFSARSSSQTTQALKIIRAVEACIKGQNISKVRRTTRTQYLSNH